MSAINIIIFTLVVLSIVVEIILNVRWVEAYYLKGLLLYSKRYKVPFPSIRPTSTYVLNTEFSDPAYIRYRLYKLCENKYAFREKYLQINAIRSPRFMHGLLVWNEEDCYVEVRGYANIVPIVLMLIVVGNTLNDIFAERYLFGVVSVISFLIIFRFMYIMQSTMFNRIGEYCAESWSRDQVVLHTNNNSLERTRDAWRFDNE